MSRSVVTPVIAVARITCGQVTRQPAYLLTVLVTVAIQAFSPALALFGFDQERSLMREFSLSTLLLASVVLAAMGTVTVLERELESGALQTLLAKPVRRGGLLLGKLLGLVAALGIALYVATISLLLADRQGPPTSVHQPWDWPVLVGGFGGALAALAASVPLGLARSKPLGPLMFRIGCLTLTGGVVLAACFDPRWRLQHPGTAFSPIIVEAVYLVFLAGVVMASAAFVMSLVAGRGALVATFVVFLAGLWLGGRDSPWLGFLPAIEVFWAGDAFYASLPGLPLSYLLKATCYAATYSLVCLLVGTRVLGRREVR